MKRITWVVVCTCLGWLVPNVGASEAPESDSGASQGAKADRGSVAVQPSQASTDPAAPVSKAGGSVTVDLLGVENAKGQLLVALFRDDRGFPDGGANAWGKRVAKPQKGSVRVVFDGVPPGPYAVSVHHDEDGDFEMDFGLFGIPTEGYGFSRDAHAPFGPPSFEDCRLVLKPDTWQRLRIHLRY